MKPACFTQQQGLYCVSDTDMLNPIVRIVSRLIAPPNKHAKSNSKDSIVYVNHVEKYALPYGEDRISHQQRSAPPYDPRSPMSLDDLCLVLNRIFPIRIPLYKFFHELLELLLVFSAHLFFFINILVGPKGVACHMDGDLQNHSDSFVICTAEESMKIPFTDHATMFLGLIVPFLWPSWLDFGEKVIIKPDRIDFIRIVIDSEGEFVPPLSCFSETFLATDA